VIDVHHDDLLQAPRGPQLEEPGVDSLRQHDRETRVQSQPPQLGDAAERLEQHREAPVGERERVAPLSMTSRIVASPRSTSSAGPNSAREALSTS